MTRPVGPRVARRAPTAGQPVEHGRVAALLPTFGVVVTFGAVAMGIAIVIQGEDRS